MNLTLFRCCVIPAGLPATADAESLTPARCGNKELGVFIESPESKLGPCFENKFQLYHKEKTRLMK